MSGSRLPRGAGVSALSLARVHAIGPDPFDPLPSARPVGGCFVWRANAYSAIRVARPDTGALLWSTHQLVRASPRVPATSCSSLSTSLAVPG